MVTIDELIARTIQDTPANEARIRGMMPTENDSKKERKQCHTREILKLLNSNDLFKNLRTSFTSMSKNRNLNSIADN